VDDVHQALMRTDFELIARRLVDVRRTQDVEALDAGRQGNRTANDRTSPLRRLDDLGCRLIDQTIVESLQANTDFLVLHDDSFERARRFCTAELKKNVGSGTSGEERARARAHVNTGTTAVLRELRNR